MDATAQAANIQQPLQVAQQLPQSAQTELLRVVDDMLHAKRARGFQNCACLKAALDAEQVSPF